MKTLLTKLCVFNCLLIIITKEHNGTIKVEGKEGEGSEFIIQLAIVKLK